MKLPLYLLFYLLLQTSLSTAQSKVIKGTVQESSTKEALGYVNIGWVNRQLGTVSDEQGNFELALPENLPDSALLRFSMIGYEAQEFLWKDIKGQKQLAVNLASVVTEIEEITVVDCSPTTRKQKGNVIRQRPMAWMGFVSKELGTEIATKIRLKKKRPTHVKSMSFWVGEHDLDSLFFRLNVYAVEKGQPGKNLLTENIFLTFVASGGQVVIDLEPYHLVYNQDVFVGLEYVRALESASEEGVNFGSNFLGKNSFVRFASQSQWVKTPILNLGFSIEVCEDK